MEEKANTDKTGTGAAGSEKAASKGRFWGYIGVFLIALSVGAVLQAYAPVYWQRLMPVGDVSVGAKIEVLEARLAKAEEKIASLSSPTASVTPSVTTAKGPDGDDLEKLKEGLAGLSGALGLVQERLEKSAEVTNQTRQQAQIGFATIVAFIQMQNAALAGQAFEKERQSLRQLAGQDQLLVDDLLKLEPAALSGAPDARTLYHEWQEKAAEAQAALRKSAAQTWQDRLLVAIESLVSIRSLRPKPGETLSFASIDLDLEKGHLVEALEKAAALPPEVQEVIKGWRARAELRRDMEKSLDDLAAHLVAREVVKENSASAQTPVQEAAP